MLSGVPTASPPGRKVVSRAVLEPSSGPKLAVRSLEAMGPPVRRCRRRGDYARMTAPVLPGTSQERASRRQGTPVRMAGMRETHPEARLLVVEDEPNILELLSASLRLAGFEVAT